MRLGVLLFNLGGPESLADVRPFLFNLFSDPEIVRFPVPALQRPVAWLISRARHKKSAGYYTLIGGGSPLRRITEDQGKALEQELRKRGVEANVYIGMRYWEPFTASALEQIIRDEISDLLLLPLYPQFSVSTTGSSFKDFVSQVESRGGLREMRRHYVTHWHVNEAYVRRLASMIEQDATKFPNTTPGSIHLLFSAHSVPESYITRGDPYLRQTQETIRLVSERLGNSYPIHLSFQSKVGPVRWLEPSTATKLRELKAQGVDQVLAIPISFVSDHIETLYELDILYRDLAEQIGIKTYHRLPAFNCDQGFINVLADLVTDRLFIQRAESPPATPSGSNAL